MKVFFLTEYSKEIGFGHLSRCLSLASVFYQKNYEVIFLIREWKEEPLRLEFQKEKLEWSHIEELNAIASEDDILIIDSYRVPKEILNKIALYHRNIVSITDSKQNHADAGIIVFGSVYGNEYEISTSKNLVLAGSKYILFRKGIREAKANEVNKNVQHVLINLGGHADNSVLKGVIQLVRDHLGECKIRIVGNSKVEEIDNVQNLGFISLPELLSEFKKTDVVITNGGQSLNEAVLLRIPTIGISVVDNQDMNLRAWHKLGVVKNFISATAPEFQEKMVDSLEELKDFNQRLRRVEIGTSLVDSNGAKRVVEKIEEWTKIDIK